MATLQIEVTDQEADRLRVLETDTGKSKDELLHLALARLLAQEAESVAPHTDLGNEARLERLRAAGGFGLITRIRLMTCTSGERRRKGGSTDGTDPR